jgi:RNA polymerase sigma-70 factor, ECF subfamily
MMLSASLETTELLEPRASESLVLRLRSREPEALAEAYDLHHEQVRRFAQRITGNEALAEDLVQEVFIALPGAAASFEGRSKLSTFIVSMAYNLSRRAIRTAARKRAMVERYKLEPLTETVDGDRQTDGAELARELVRALETLPEEQRDAFTLMELEEFTSAEVSEIVGAPEGTVRTRLFHAKRKLREHLESWRPL